MDEIKYKDPETWILPDDMLWDHYEEDWAMDYFYIDLAIDEYMNKLYGLWP